MVSMFGSCTIILSHKEAQKAQKDLFNQFVPFVPFVAFLFTWCLNVDVDLLRSSASKYSSSKHKQPNQYDQHKNHQYRDNADAAAAATFFGHEGPP